MATLSHSFVIQSDGSILPTLARKFTVSWDNAVFALHDYQCGDMDYKPRKAAIQTEVPETLHLATFDHIEVIDMTRELAEFYLATLRMAYPGLSREDAITRWHEMTRTSVCFSDNGASWDTGKADYLTDPASTLPPMGFKISIACCGNVFKKVSGTTIEAIDYRKPLPDPAQLYRAKPWLFFWATQCYMQKTGVMENGRPQYEVSRFPHFRPVGTLLPILGTDGVTRFSEKWRMRPIARGAIYSPYVP